ncbi:MAG: HlyD family efflux transporter periplasmic adaptor subunit [Pseudomonadota bacterium]
MFRKEVLDAQKKNLQGNVIIAQPHSLTLVIAVVVLCVLTAAIYLSLGNYTRKQNVRGYIRPQTNIITMYPQQAGTLSELFVDENQAVKKGQPLFKIVNHQHNSNKQKTLSESIIDELNAQKKLLKQERDDNLQREGHETQRLQLRLANLEQEAAGINRQMALAQAHLQVAEKQHALLKKLNQQNHVSDIELQNQHEKRIQSQLQVEALQQKHLQLMHQVRDMPLQIESLRQQTKEQDNALLQRQFALQRQLDEARNTFETIRVAPQEGKVTSLFLQEGASINTQQAILMIEPETQHWIAELAVPSHAAGRLAVGQSAKLRVDAFPYQRFGLLDATISRVNRNLVTSQNSDLPLQLAEPFYRIEATLTQQHVEAYGQEFPLKPGLLLQADVILESRSLWDWLMDPLYSLQGRL